MDKPLSRRVLMRGAGAITAAVTVSALGNRATPLAMASPVRSLDSSSTIPAPTFHVSELGNDDLDGQTPETAWASIQKVNSSLPKDRSTVLFRRGDTFYGELALPFGCEVGAYGAGARPILTMFKLLNRSTGWTEHDTGIWKIDLSLATTHDGYTFTTDANIGYLVVDGVVHPALKRQLSELSAPWDFCSDIEQGMLYVAATSNPTTLASDIKAAPNGNAYGPSGRVIRCMQGSNEIHDVHITGTGGCGIGGVGPDVHVHDCLLDYIGGSILLDGSNNRYGNGIENWVNVKRWLIENNEITQVYDVAWSPQGRAGTEGSWEDITFRNNHIHDCSQTFEFWSKGSSTAGGFKRIVIEGNVCERAGYSVFSDARPDQDVRVHLLTYHWQTPADIIIQDNVFDEAHGAYSYHSYEPVGLVTRNNTIQLKAGTKMQHQRSETVEEAVAWQVATGRETGSAIVVLP